MSTQLSLSQILTYFSGQIHCSQIVLGQWAEELGLDIETARMLAAPFGGGGFRGDMCGAVAGALMAIGLRYGHSELGDEDGNEILKAKVAEFQERFIQREGSIVCRELTGYNFSEDGAFEQAKEEGVISSKCPHCINSALAILDEIM